MPKSRRVRAFERQAEVAAVERAAKAAASEREANSALVDGQLIDLARSLAKRAPAPIRAAQRVRAWTRGAR